MSKGKDKDALAQEALVKCFHQGGFSRTGPKIFQKSTDFIAAKEYLSIFVSTLRESHPDATFTSTDILRWLELYSESLGEDNNIPQFLFNAYSLGRFIKKNQEELDLIEVGSYANRTVYGINETREEEPHHE